MTSGLHAAVATVRGWRQPITNTQMVLTVATAAIGIGELTAGESMIVVPVLFAPPCSDSAAGA
jgi:hypothetical protein